MFLPYDQLVTALTHGDFLVRSAALQVLSHLPKDDGTALTKAQEAIERHGWGGAFDYTHLLTELAINQESLDWAVSSLPSTSQKACDLDHAILLLKIISRGNPTWLTERKEDLIQKATASVAESSTQAIQAFSETIEQRIRFYAQNTIECYEEIQNYCAQFDTDSEFDHFDTQLLDIATDRISEENDLATIETKIVQALSEVSPEEFKNEDWFAGALIILAGKIKCTRVVPTLLTLFESDWDWWNEQIPLAISRMASDKVLEQIASVYFNLPEHGRFFLSDRFTSFRTPRTIAVLESILREETDPDNRRGIAEGLAIQFDGSAASEAKAILDEAPNNPDGEFLMQILYTHAQLDNPGFGQADVKRWKELLEEQFARRQQLRKQLETSNLFDWEPPSPDDSDFPKGTPIVSETPKIGRNEPCPCGSGKKYKKCCL